MDASEIQRVNDPADPRRCQAITPQGQCWNIAAEHSDKCWAHGGNIAQQNANKKEIYNIRVAKIRSELQRHSSHPEILRLEEEIGILRMIIQEHLNAVDSPTDLITKSTVLQQLVVNVEKLVVSYEKTLQRCGQMIDRQALSAFAAQVAQKAAAHITNPKDIAAFMQDVVELVENAGSAE